MSTVQSGDVLLFQETDKGGEMLVENGLTHMTTGPETAAYICIMGGNKKDAATPDTKKFEWVGNEDEPQEFKVRSRFQSLLNGIPLTSGNMKAFKDAAIFDFTNGFGDTLLEISVDLRIVSVKSIYMRAEMLLENGPFVFEGTFVR